MRKIAPNCAVARRELPRISELATAADAICQTLTRRLILMLCVLRSIFTTIGGTMPTPPILTVPYRNDSCSHRSFQVRMSAIVIASLAFPIVAGLESGDTLAQTRQVTPTQAAPQKQFFPVRQMPLTKELIQGFVAATEEVNKTTDNAEEDIDKLRPETVAKLDGVARKCGLASYDQYKQISENIGLIESGFDDVTKRYVGREALIRIRASRVKADKKMSPESKTERLTDLNDQLRVALPEVQYKANIALIAKYYDRLTAIAR